MILVNKEGKPVSLEGIDPKLATVLQEAFGGITHQMSAATVATLRPLQKTLDGVAGQIKTLTDSSAENETKKPKPNAGSIEGQEQGNNQQADPVLQAVLDGMNKLTDRFDALDADNKAAKEARTSLGITEEYFAANHPNMNGGPALIARIASGNPKDEAAVKAAVETERKYMSDMYGEESTEKAFSASISNEGGKDGQIDDTEAELKSKTEKLEGKLARAV